MKNEERVRVVDVDIWPLLRKLVVEGMDVPVVRAQFGFVVILHTEDGRQLHITTHDDQAVYSISSVLEDGAPQSLRPTTFDLVEKIFRDANLVVREVYVHDLIGGVYIANITLARLVMHDDDMAEEFLSPRDARPTDAIGLALRFVEDGADIFVATDVLDRAQEFQPGLASDTSDDDDDE